MQDDSSGGEYSHRELRRATAIELPRSSFKSTIIANVSETHRNNKSADQPSSSSAFAQGGSGTSAGQQQQGLLLPSMSEPSNYFKKSFESLQKNSSTDTEYSLQPYKVVKQSSNETSTSLTGSFNVEHATAIGCDPSHLDHSLDANDSSGMNQTGIENQAYDATKAMNAGRSMANRGHDEDKSSSLGSTDQPIPSPGPPRPLKKQFSVDQGMRITVEPTALLTAVQDGLAPPLLTKSATPCASPLSRGFHYLRESSSTSTEEFKEDHAHVASIPEGDETISGHQSTESVERRKSTGDNGKNTDNSFNETLC